jgi:hypothetical protein
MQQLFVSGERFHKLFFDEDFSPLWYRPESVYEGKPNSLAPIPQLFGHTPRSYYSEEWLKEVEKEHHWYMTDGWNEDGSLLYAVLENGKVKITKFDPA